MQTMTAASEGENRDFTAEEAEELDKKEGEFRSLTERWERAEELYNAEKEVKRSLKTPVNIRIEDDDNVPLTLSEWRSKTRPQRPWDTPEYRSAYWHYMTVKSLSELEHRGTACAVEGDGRRRANLVPDRVLQPDHQHPAVHGTDKQTREHDHDRLWRDHSIPAVTSHGVATWTAENAAYTASDEIFGQVSLNAFKAGRTVIVSEELLANAAFGLDGYLAQELGESIGVLEETAYTVGDGSGKPMGIANAASGVTVSQAATGNSTSFTYAALVNFIFTVPYQYRRNAAWIFADTAVKSLYPMVDGQCRPLWNVNVSETGTEHVPRIPHLLVADLAAMAASAKSGIFGDIRRGYMIRRVNGFSLQRQSSCTRTTARWGSADSSGSTVGCVLADAMRVLQHSAT